MSFGRSRARFYDLLVPIRRFQAVCVVAGIIPHCRWVASEMNPADGPSREFEPAKLRSYSGSSPWSSPYPVLSHHGEDDAELYSCTPAAGSFEASGSAHDRVESHSSEEEQFGGTCIHPAFAKLLGDSASKPSRLGPKRCGRKEGAKDRARTRSSRVHSSRKGRRAQQRIKRRVKGATYQGPEEKRYHVPPSHVTANSRGGHES